jgi:hypothetical protein
MKINVKRQNRETMSYSRRPETRRPTRGCAWCAPQSSTLVISTSLKPSWVSSSASPVASASPVPSPSSSSPPFRGHQCSWNSPARPSMAAALDHPRFWFWSPDRRARVVTAFESFIHREGLDNFECEIATQTPATPVWSRTQSQAHRPRSVSPDFKTPKLSVGQRVEQLEVSPQNRRN